MNNWQDDLLKIAKEFNIEGGKSDNLITNKDNNSIGVYNNNIGNNKLSSEKRKIINIKEGGIKMISAEAAKGDIEKLIVEAKDVSSVGIAAVLILRGILVVVKVILTCRTNTVRLMDKLGIPREEERKEVKKEVNTQTTL